MLSPFCVRLRGFVAVQTAYLGSKHMEASSCFVQCNLESVTSFNFSNTLGGLRSLTANMKFKVLSYPSSLTRAGCRHVFNCALRAIQLAAQV